MNRRAFLRAAAVTAGTACLANHIAFARDAVILDPFPLRRQETPYTCGPAAARMVLEYLGHPIPETGIAKRMGTRPAIGTSHGMFIRALRAYLKDFHTGLGAQLVHGEKFNGELVLDNLERKRPVAASFLTENHFKPGTVVGHFIVIIGCDPGASTFTIANPFGRIEDTDISRFFRQSAWAPQPGDIPGVDLKDTPRIHVPRTAAVLTG